MWRECVLRGARVYTTAQVTGCDPSLGQEGIIGRQGCRSGILDAGLGSLESVAAGAIRLLGSWGLVPPGCLPLQHCSKQAPLGEWQDLRFLPIVSH